MITILLTDASYAHYRKPAQVSIRKTALLRAGVPAITPLALPQGPGPRRKITTATQARHSLTRDNISHGRLVCSSWTRRHKWQARRSACPVITRMITALNLRADAYAAIARIEYARGPATTQHLPGPNPRLDPAPGPQQTNRGRDEER